MNNSDEKAVLMNAEEPCETVILSLDALRWLEAHEGRITLKLYRYLLAGRFGAKP